LRRPRTLASPHPTAAGIERAVRKSGNRMRARRPCRRSGAWPMVRRPSRYSALIESIFFDHYRDGITEFVWRRPELKAKAEELGIVLPDNLGDVIYSIRYRTPLPARVLDTQPEGREWIIEGAGRSAYRFKLVSANRIRPREDLVCIAIPDATPELIRAYALDDEQALLAIVRYNRLIDTFLGLTTYS